MKEWGLSQEQIARVLEENGREVGEVKKQLAGFDEMKERIKQLEAAAEQSRQQLEQADQWQQKAREVESQWRQKWARRDFEEALGRALRRSGARNEKAVRALLDEEGLQLGEDGELQGLKEQLGEIRIQHGYLFSEEKAPPVILRPGNRDMEDAQESRIREIMGLPGFKHGKDGF